MKNKVLYGLLSVALIIFIAFYLKQSKSGSPTKEINPAFTNYISAFSSGVISNGSNIRIRLMEEQHDIEVDEEIDETLFEFSPEIKGVAVWIDTRTIEFRPESLLVSGKMYEAEFHLDKIMDVPDDLETLAFNFQTMAQSLTVDFEGFKTYQIDDLTWQKMNGILSTADIAYDENIEELLHATQNGIKLNISWDHGGDGKYHHFTVDSINRTEELEQVLIHWEGTKIGLEKEGDKLFDIAPLGEFKVIDLRVNQQPTQFVKIFLSDPLNMEQDIEGLVYLKSGDPIKLVKEENAIIIYPKKRQTGSTEVIVDKGIRNIMDYQLMEKFTEPITFYNIKPALSLMGNGVILPSTNGLIFPFKAVNLKAVEVKIIKVYEDNVAQFLQVNQFDGNREMKRVGRIVYKNDVALRSDKPIDYGMWNNFSLDLSKMILAEPGAIYRVQLDFKKSHSLYPCEDDDAGNQDDIINSLKSMGDDPEEQMYEGPGNNWYYYGNDDYYDYSEPYNYNERNNPCKSSYYARSQHRVTRNVFASDLGIIAKAGSGTDMTVAITDIKTTEPISGAEVEIYNFQNKLMATKSTDADGFTTIDLTKKPFLLVAKKDKQIGYLRLDDGSALSLSMFDVGGQKNKKGIKGFIYGERGVWRPGDSLYLEFILEDKNDIIPENHPVVFELYTPEQQLYIRKVKTRGLEGFYDFRTATNQEDPTGNWLAKVKVGGSTFSKTIKIEAIKPNRLKLILDFHADVLRNTETNKGDLIVKWLHGAKAKNLKADVELSMRKGITRFDNYVDFTFDDDAKSFRAEENMVFEGNLDSEGKAIVYPDINVRANAPGMLKAYFKVRAFERGGDFSINSFSMPYSPYRGYVGLKIPEGKGWNGALYSNEPNVIPIVTVNEHGKPVDRENLKIEIFNVYWRWWWEHSDEDNLAQYVSNRNRNLLKTEYISTKDGKAMYEMNLGGNYYGRKFIRITDEITGHSVGKAFYTTYKGWWSKPGSDNPGGAEMLSFSTDKTNYNVGDKVKVSLPDAKQGRALVSIESGSKVLETFWVKLKEEDNTFDFKVTDEMAPNVYVHITFIQPHKQMVNDLPIRLYGVQNIKVEDPQTRLNPEIAMADVLEPEGNVSIKISEATGREMVYTVAVVDEGLLDLTNFKTPDPWKHFYAREALGVRTWDMYRYVMGSFSGEMAGLLALGGDEQGKNKGKKKANRFIPVVKFLGPFKLEKGKQNKHEFTMPNYVGSVRTMVIAGYKGSYGSADKTTPVKKPLMVLATLPRVIGPGERLKLPVTIFAMDKKIKNVSIEVKTNDLLIADEKKKSITFTELGDEVVNFELEVVKKLGIAKVEVLVKSGKETAHYEVELDVRIPNPRVNEVISVVIEPGETWNQDYAAVGMAGTNKGTVEISRMPPINIDERLKYLIRYPHGCIEQTTSSVFPQVYLDKIVDLSKEKKAEIQVNIAAGIERLKLFQISTGGFSYWPNEHETASDWGSNYAGHFLVEAKSRGYSVKDNMMKDWVKFQKQRANAWTSDMGPSRRHYYNSGMLIQAYRLYTLALANKPALGAMNRMREMKNLNNAALWRLAAAYYLLGKKNVASELIANSSTNVDPYKELSYSYGSSERDQAMILETLTLMNRKNDAKNILDELSGNLGSSRWYSTQTTAYTLLAIAKFISTTGEGNEVKYDYTLNREASQTVATTLPISQVPLKMKGIEGGKISISNNGQQTLFVNMQLEGIPLVGDKTSSENNLIMGVRYLDINGKPMDPSSIEQGTDFIAEVKLSHPGYRVNYKEMALTQIFPSGWEIRNLRMDLVESNKAGDKPRYQDIRDDRVYTYFDLNKNSTKTFKIILNAAYLGRFYLPTVYCEAMYDNEIYSRKAGKWIEVVEAGGTISASN